MRKVAADDIPRLAGGPEGRNRRLQAAYDARRAVFEIQPIADYYFAGVVGMEAAKIRILYATPRTRPNCWRSSPNGSTPPPNRTDRLVSDLVFDVISQIRIAQAPEQHKLPHDEVVRVVLERLGLRTTLEARHLLDDLLFRHHLAEPLACNVPQWWVPFRAKFTLIREGAAVVTASPHTWRHRSRRCAGASRGV